MKLIAIFAGASLLFIGFAGVIFPEMLLIVGRHLVTPAGLYIVAAFRIGIGLVLILAASASRLPKALRLLGAIMVIGGLLTPLMGADRSRAMLDWCAAQGPFLTRMLAGLGIAVGAFIMFAVVSRRRTA